MKMSLVEIFQCVIVVIWVGFVGLMGTLIYWAIQALIKYVGA